MPRAVFATTLAVLFLFAAPTRADEAEDKAAKVIEGAGGQVIREPSLPGKPIVGIVLPPKFGPDEVKALASFKKLFALALSGPGVTDEVMKDVGRLKTLIQLVVEAKALTDAGVK